MGPGFDLLGVGPPVQLAFCVSNARTAALAWVNTTGAGPFFLRPHIAVTDVRYRGRPSTFDHTSAYGQWGGVMVELVESHNTEPNILSELGTGSGDAEVSPRLHHVACLVDDFDEVLSRAAQHGIEIAFTAKARTTPFAFLDTQRLVGCFLEIYPKTNSVADFYATVAAAASGWDGSDPVRSLG
jgi:catechol 2,3-dioxygenase-like lactoylglutathione lyase family enzyme